MTNLYKKYKAEQDACESLGIQVEECAERVRQLRNKVEDLLSLLSAVLEYTDYCDCEGHIVCAVCEARKEVE